MLSIESVTSSALIALNLVVSVNCKGGATKGAAAGGGAGVIYNDGVGNYTEGEMEVALIILAVILVVFFAVCTCQCYQKVLWELSEKWPPDDTKRPMPCAPYSRDNPAAV